MIESIPRIGVPTAAALYADCVKPLRPVIVRGLFAGQPLEEFRALEAVRRHWGDVELAVRDEYASTFLESLGLGGGSATADFSKLKMRPQPRQPMTLGQYFTRAHAEPTMRLLSSELPLPAAIQASFELPEALMQCCPGGEGDWKAQLFVGNAGNIAHLHYDGDYRQVLFHQVAGRKRVILFPATVSRKLLPFRNFSTLFLENMSEPEKDGLVQYLGGSQCLLAPGETLFIPATTWHYLEYVDHGLSFNLRFGRNRFTAFLAEKLHEDMHLQNLAALMSDPAVAEAALLGTFAQLEAAEAALYSSDFAKYRAIQELSERLYSDVCAGSFQGMYALTNFRSALDHLARVEMKVNGGYMKRRSLLRRLFAVPRPKASS